MRHFLTVILVVLGVTAAIAAAAGIVSLPAAVARFDLEPEDVYLRAFWAVLASGLSLFWLGAAAHQAAGRPQRFSRHLRVAAQAVAAAGVLFAILAPLAQPDGILAVLLSAACLLSGLAVHRTLGLRGEKVNDAQGANAR